MVFRRTAFGIRIPKPAGPLPHFPPLTTTPFLSCRLGHTICSLSNITMPAILPRPCPVLILCIFATFSRFPRSPRTPLTLQTQPRRAPLRLLHPPHPTHRPDTAPDNRAYHLSPPRPGRRRRRTRISGRAMWKTGRGCRDEESGVAVAPRVLGRRGRVEGERCYGG